jgi:sulfate permease, SulP family
MGNQNQAARTIKPGWGDLLGGVTSMVVALPAAIAFGVLVFSAIGPAHAGAGALAGALGAIALGLVVPMLGRNGGFITAPCAPAAAVLSGFAAKLAADHLPFAKVVALMVVTSLLSATFQVGFGVLRLGRFIKYIPYQVVSGYLSGVALIIAIGQLPKLLGLPQGIGLWDGLIRPALWQWPAIAVGAVTVGAMALTPRLTKRIPATMAGLGAGVAAYFAMGAFRHDLLTLSGNALVVGPIQTSSSLWDAARGATLSLGTVGLADLETVAATAMTLALLLSIDTLKTGVVLDILTRRRHDSNRELVAQGVGNAVAALGGGLPGAGTMGPSLVNVASGGSTAWSGLAEGACAALVFALLRPAIAWMPIGVLAAILLAVAWRMFDWKLFRLVLRPATRLDFAVIAAVIAVAQALGLIQATLVGVVLAILLFIRDQIRGAVIAKKRTLREVASKTARLSEAREILDRHGDEGLLVELQSDLFFGTTDQLFTDLMEDIQRCRFILLDLRRVQSIDYTAANLLRQMNRQLEEHGGRLLLSGMPSSSPTRRDFERYLSELGLLGDGSAITVHETRNSALEWMEDQMIAAAGCSDRDERAPLHLSEVELFREFDPEVLRALGQIVRPAHRPAGTPVFAQGDTGDELYFIRRGKVEILLPLPEGKYHHLATMGRGDYFGEMSFLDQGVRSADAVAKTDTDLFVLSRQSFNTVAHDNASVASRVFARLALLVSRRLRSANTELHALEQR